MSCLTGKIRSDVAAGIFAGVVGLGLISAIWVGLVLPAPVQIGGGILSGDQVAMQEHEWGFNQFAKGGPELCAVVGHNVTITLRNDGRNLHGFQIVRDGGVFIAGLNKSDLLVPGEVRKITVRLTQPGSYYYICPVSGHRLKGMVGVCLVQSGC